MLIHESKGPPERLRVLPNDQKHLSELTAELPEDQEGEPHHGVFLTEALMREYVARKGDSLFSAVQRSLQDVRYNEDAFSPEQVAMLKDLTEELS